MQKGQICRKGRSWYLRVRENVDGKPTQVWHKLARYSEDYRSKKDVQPIADPILLRLNGGGFATESGMTFGAFYEQRFLPHVEVKKKPSTYKFYREAFENHLKDSVGKIRLRDFTTFNAQEVLDVLDGKLSHQSILRIKTAMSAVFTYARQRDVIRHANPVQGAKAEGKYTKPERYAYSLDEINHMLKVLPEPAHTVIATAAFTGLRSGELRGLRWEDFDGEAIEVKRSVWRTHVGETKTEGSIGAVPVIPLLAGLLEAHRKRVGPKKHDFIFAGEKKRFALHLDNLSRRVITPALSYCEKCGKSEAQHNKEDHTFRLGECRWHGWHGFRRGLASNLYSLGIPPKVIQSILRHANVETTTTHYIVIDDSQNKKAMAELSNLVREKIDAA